MSAAGVLAHRPLRLDVGCGARGSVSAANPRWTERQHALAGFWGWQRDGDHTLWDVHKAGYDEELLAEALTHAGFVRVARQPDRPWNLSLAAHAS